MERNKHDMVSALRTQILRIEGFRTDYGPTRRSNSDLIQQSFPGGVFPTGCTHEFLLTETENFSATGAFISAIIPSWINPDGVIVWVCAEQKVMPASLAVFGVKPHHVLFVQARDKDILWVTEEALKCKAVAAVVCEVKDITFTQSRRLQLAVEQSKTTGFILRRIKGKVGVTASVSRWRIGHLPSDAIDDLPGIGFPTWNVELLRVRNGKPGTWQIRCNEGRLEYIVPEENTVHDHQANVG